jgi:phage tail protein X
MEFDHESIDDENLDYRETYNERTYREKGIRKRFAWLAQVALVSMTILVVILLTNNKFFARAENFIQALFQHTSSAPNHSRDASARKDEPEVVNKQSPPPQEVERQTDVSMERRAALSSLEETNSQEQLTPATRVNEAETKFVVVQTGDTFRDILLKRYGTYNRTIIERVLEANPAVQDINTILIGQRIALPNL